MAIYLVALEMGGTVLGMILSHRAHLTHGAPVKFNAGNCGTKQLKQGVLTGINAASVYVLCTTPP